MPLESGLPDKVYTHLNGLFFFSLTGLNLLGRVWKDWANFHCLFSFVLGFQGHEFLKQGEVYILLFHINQFLAIMK